MLHKISISKFFDIVAFGVLLLQLTELFRFALFGGVSLPVIAAITILLLTAHLFVNFKIVKKCRNKLILTTLLVLGVGIPIIMTPYHLFNNYMKFGSLARVLANNIIYFEIAASAMILASKYSFTILRRWFLLVMSIVVVGFGVNYINPGLFYALKLAVWGVEKNVDSIDFTEVERVGGFYLKSTYASASLVMLAPVGVLLSSRKSFIGAILAYLFFATLVFLTGSRSGIAIVLACSFIFLIPFFRTVAERFNTSVSDSLRLGVAFLPFFLVIFGILISGALMIAPTVQRDALIGRAATLFSTDKLMNDESLSQRNGAQLKYLEKIYKNPFWGYGATHREKLRRIGEFWLTSHNTFIEMTFFYGILYFLILIGLISLLMWSKWSDWITGVSGLNYMQMLAIGFLLYCLFANTLMQNRSFFFSLGFLLGIANKNIRIVKSN